MNAKKRSILPASFLMRLGVFFVLSGVMYLFRNWYNVHFYKAVVAMYNSYQIFLVYPLLLLFAYSFRDRIWSISHYPFKPFWSFGFYGVSLVLLFIPFSVFHDVHFGTILTYLIVLYVMYACVFLAIFGPKFAGLFVRELLFLGNVSTIFLLCSYLIDVYWKSFAFVILRALGFVLPIVSKGAIVNVSDLSVSVHGFRVIVGAPCAGVYSLFLFAVFFLLTLYYLGKTKKIARLRSFIAFVLGFLVLFTLNIVRIAMIVFVGAYYSPRIAISIFHEYTASVFFLIFLFFFLSKVVPFLLKDASNGFPL